MDFQTIILTKDEGITTITLNRPEALNALSEDLIGELLTALRDLEDDEATKVVILKGAGRAFCAGMDLKRYSLGSVKDQVAYYGPWQAIEDLSKPVIAAVHGYAITGGYLLAICCDIVIAAEDTKFADTHAKWGLIPYGGETQRLPLLIGSKKAKELMFTSEMITAGEAEHYGLINKVVPLEQLNEAALEMARKILRNNQDSVKAIKWLINRGAESGFAAGLRLESITTKWGRVNAQEDPDRQERLRVFRNNSRD